MGTTRRRFLAVGAAAGVGMCLPKHLEALVAQESRSEQLKSLRKRLESEGIGTSFFDDERFKLDEEALRLCNIVRTEKKSLTRHIGRKWV